MPYTDSLVHYYDLSVPVGLPDLGRPGLNPGVGANIASNPNGVGGGIAAEFNGNNSNYNLGDTTELNSVTAFTIAFWMNQDVLDVLDVIFTKQVNDNNDVTIYTFGDGNMYLHIGDGANSYAIFDYSTVINAGQWHNFVMVFDGSQAVRLRVYVDAVPVVLGFLGTIPAVTADLSGQNAYIGYTGNVFDGKLDSFGIFSQPLTQLQVYSFMVATRRGVL